MLFMNKKLLKLVLLSLFLGFSVVVSAVNYNDGVPILAEGADPTEAQENAIREGAKNWCSEKEDDQKEQCALDYFVGHNYEGEPSCD